VAISDFGQGDYALALRTYVRTILSGFRGRRVALVIGNAGYGGRGQLDCPARDAEAFGAVLKRVGFAVTVGTDLDVDAMRESFRSFDEAATDAEVALIYFSGHGLQYNGANYILPVGADSIEQDRVKDLICVNDVIRSVSAKAGSCLIFLDACRNNPFAERVAKAIGGTKRIHVGGVEAAEAGARPGLAEFELAGGERETFISFATAPGTVAYDGKGEFSPFTEALLNFVAIPGLALDDLVKRITRSVREATENRQIPWNNSCLTEDFYFRRKSAAPIAGMVLPAIVSGIASAILVNSSLNEVSTLWGYPLLPGILFAAVVAAGVAQWGGRSGWVLPFAFTLMAWIAASFSYDLVKDKVGVKSAITRIDAELVAAEARLQEDVKALKGNLDSGTIKREDYQNEIKPAQDDYAQTRDQLLEERRKVETVTTAVPGVAAGIVGAVAVIVGSALTVPALRQFLVWTLTALLGGLAILAYGLLRDLLPGNQIAQDMLLYGSWQAVVAGGIGFGFSQHVVQTQYAPARYFHPPRLTRPVLIVAALAIVSSIVSTSFGDPLEKGWLAGYLSLAGVNLGPAIAFGLVIGLTVHLMLERDWGRVIACVVITCLAWVGAVRLAVDLFDKFDIIVCLAAGGFAGAALTGLAPAILHPVLRHQATWLILLLAGTVMTLPFSLIGPLLPESETAPYWLLYIPWQLSVAVTLAYGCQRSKQTAIGG
jgi:hypothetical protein